MKVYAIISIKRETRARLRSNFGECMALSSVGRGGLWENEDVDGDRRGSDSVGSCARRMYTGLGLKSLIIARKKSEVSQIQTEKAHTWEYNCQKTCPHKTHESEPVSELCQTLRWELMLPWKKEAYRLRGPPKRRSCILEFECIGSLDMQKNTSGLDAFDSDSLHHLPSEKL